MIVSSKYMIYWALAVWGQARYLSLTEALHNTDSLRVSGEETFVYNPLNDIFCINYGDQRIFSIWNHHKCLSYIFLVHLNTYVMGLRSLEIFLLSQCEGPKYVVFTYKQFMTGYYDRIIAVFKWPPLRNVGRYNRDHEEVTWHVTPTERMKTRLISRDTWSCVIVIEWRAAAKRQNSSDCSLLNKQLLLFVFSL